MAGTRKKVDAGVVIEPRPVKRTATPVARPSNVTQALIQRFVEAIDAFAAVVGEGVTLPKPAEMARLQKARRSAPSLVSTLVNLAHRYEVASPSFPLERILADQALVATLAPVQERINAAQKLVNTISTMAQSDAWKGAMVTYGILKSESRGNPVLRKALQPVRDEMRIKYVTPEGKRTVKRSRAAKKTAVAKGNKGTAGE